VPNQKAGLVCQPDASSISLAMETMKSKGKDAFISGLKEEKRKYSWNALTAALLELAAH
jgi:hypothetical protein